MNSSESYNDSESSMNNKKKDLKSKNKHIENSFSSSDNFKSCRGNHKQNDPEYNGNIDAKCWWILFTAVMDSFRKPGMHLVLFPESYKKCIKGLIPGCSKVALDFLPPQKIVHKSFFSCWNKEEIIDPNYLFFKHISCKINGKWVGLNEYDPSIQELLRSFGFAVDRVKRPPPKKK